MTQPAQPAPHAHGALTVRGIISILETVAFVVATVLATMNNGADFRHAIVIALLGFSAHGVNHNAGGSPV